MAGDQKAGYRNEKFRDPDSLSDFPIWYAGGIRGISDMDYIYEKNGNFMIGEGKWVPFGDIFEIPKGQTITLLSLYNSLINKRVVFVCAQKRLSETSVVYYIKNIEPFILGAYEEENHRGQTVLRMKLSSMEGPLTKQQFSQWQLSIHESFENK